MLLALVESGMPRDDAYRIVQEAAQRAWDTGTPLRELIGARDLGIDLDAIVRPRRATRATPTRSSAGCPERALRA